MSVSTPRSADGSRLDLAAPVAAANRAFGPEATAWAARLPATLPLVAGDFGSVAHAFAEAARRRRHGEPFVGSLLMDDARARCALFVAAPLVLAQTADYDTRFTVLDAVASRGLTINEKPQIDYERFDSRYLRSALEFLITADVIAVRSSVERERLCDTLGRRFLHMTATAPLDPSVPPPIAHGRSSSTSIVVWAPNVPAEACGMFAFALEEFRRPVIVVCGPGRPAAMRAGTRFVPVADGAAALAQAGVIVDASLSDPGTARALARWGVPLATATTTGALDWLDGITTYSPWAHRSIQTAVANALGYRAPRERAEEVPERALRSALRAAAPRIPEQGPLVSVIVPTRNQRASLHDALASIAAQYYPHFEIVLVNDGGPPLERPLPAGDRLRVIEFAENRGVNAALNAGIAAARGTYIALLADDDAFCPDHLARLVEALEQRGGDVAHGIELIEHFDCSSDGTSTLSGHSLICGDPATPTSLHIWNYIGGPSIMFRRSVFDAVGPFDERAGHLSDMEMWLRMSARFEFCHVDRVIAIMSMRNDASQASAVSGVQTAAFYRTIYDLHPTPRPAVQSSRERHLRDVEAIPEVHTVPQLTIT